MLNKDINSVSPKFRDLLLSKSIGKNGQFKEPLIDPIGKFTDVYSNVPFLTKSHTNFNILEYTNENIKNEFYKDYRDIYGEIEYKKQANKFTNNYTYEDYIKKNIGVISTNAILSYLKGDTVSFGIGGNDEVSLNYSYDQGNSLFGRVSNVITNQETKIAEIGVKNLAFILSNSVLDKTRRKTNLFDWIKKPLEYVEAMDKLDFEKLKFDLPKIGSFVFPIYLYTDLKNNEKRFMSLNSKFSTNWDTDGDVLVDGVVVSDVEFNKESILYKTQQLIKNKKIENILYSDQTVTHSNPLTDSDGIRFREFSPKSPHSKIENLSGYLDKNNRLLLDSWVKRVRPNKEKLQGKSVLEDTGMVKISPYSDFKNGDVDVHKYMFSLENLAWRERGIVDSLINNTSQYGPDGGRIMWFPPYDIKFSDNTSVGLNSDNFIGRGEPVYTYINTERSGVLSFKLIVDHPSVLNYYNQNNIENDEDYDRLFLNKYLPFGEKKDVEKDVIQEKPAPENTPKEQTYTFKIFFPNYYTGIDDAKTTADEPITYLYLGRNCEKLPSQSNGYEMDFNQNGEGLTDPILTTPCFGDYYYYRVDEEYKNKKQSILTNYKDTHSDGLNSSNGLSNFSFKEFYKFLHMGEDSKNISAICKTIKKIEINGGASHQGGTKLNKKIATNRGKVVESWLKNNISNITFPNLSVENITSKEVYKEGIAKTININDIDMKRERVVIVRMTTSSETKLMAPDEYKYEEQLKSPSQELETGVGLRSKKGLEMYSYSNSKQEELYNDESKFFKKVISTDDIIMKKMSDKIKYFHPAFHSTTPEGFNSRLTFLHQCTRQGSTKNTVGASGNMAFGKPPICILRVGDFYNTKVIFTDLNIDFDPLVWDLNPSGIGVQPMIANINMSFKFIGGSDLTGPIARLQNAITFNFFANTGVYDDRNDRIISNKNGKDEYYTIYNQGVYDTKTEPKKSK